MYHVSFLLIITAIFYRPITAQTICNTTTCNVDSSTINSPSYTCTENVNTCSIDCSAGTNCHNLIIYSSARTTTVSCVNANTCNSLQLHCGYNTNNPLTECKLNCQTSDSCNSVQVNCNGDLDQCGIGPATSANSNAIHANLTCNLSDASNLCQMDCGNNICDSTSPSTVICSADNKGTCECTGSCDNVNTITAGTTATTNTPSMSPTVPTTTSEPSLSLSKAPSKTPSISPSNPPSPSNDTPLPSESPIPAPTTSPVAGFVGNTPNPTPNPTANPVTDRPTFSPFVGLQVADDKSFIEEQIIWIIVIGSVVLCCICIIIIFVVCRTRKLIAMKKERESNKMVEHVNMSIVPVSQDSPIDDGDGVHMTNLSGKHMKQRSTSMMIKKYLNTQDIEANAAIVGDASPTVSQDPNETDLETSVNNFAAAIDRQNTYSYSTQIAHQRLGTGHKKGTSITTSSMFGGKLYRFRSISNPYRFIYDLCPFLAITPCL